MGLFDKFFGSKSEEEKSSSKNLNWVDLTDSSQLEDIFSLSESRPQIVYKHSTTCGISSMVLRMFTKSYRLEEDQADLYFLDIHRSRSVSNELAARCGIRHESPQLIVLKERNVVAHSSHGCIAELDLEFVV